MKSHTDHIAIVLYRPRFSGNIGAAARCGKNMGINHLIVVDSQQLDEEEMKRRATHVAADIIDEIRYYTDLREALSEFQYVIGTTARLGSARGPVISPREMAERVAEFSAENKVALLFGPEDAGLTNDDLRLCHLIVNIPTAEFKSLNLSHAVMILCYEIFSFQASSAAAHFKPKMATSRELEGMYGQIRELLLTIGFLNSQNPDYWMMHIRRLLYRTDLQSREVRIIRGICRQMKWMLEQDHRAKAEVSSL
ncbi:MAG: RNA methyltransferase [Syntrophobacterales bacterium]|jgi:tRNA/rRNA methyltransferase|nr:RNA methyltransferase [Syntrophobacterales bacterium]